MVFNDISGRSGLIQRIEKWTNKGDGAISGDATLLKIVTADINEEFDDLMPLMLSYSQYPRWDDTNHTDLPIATVNIVSGQNDYKIAEDDNSLDILNLTDIRILTSASATQYVDLEEMTIDDPRALSAQSPNTSETGVPSAWLKRGNIIFLYPKPNYASTNGIKMFFEREQSYFVSTDTTKEPGIPKPFHRLLGLKVALGRVMIDKPTETQLIAGLERKIAVSQQALVDMISMRNPTKSRLSVGSRTVGATSGVIGWGGNDSNK